MYTRRISRQLRIAHWNVFLNVDRVTQHSQTWKSASRRTEVLAEDLSTFVLAMGSEITRERDWFEFLLIFREPPCTCPFMCGRVCIYSIDDERFRKEKRREEKERKEKDERGEEETEKKREGTNGTKERIPGEPWWLGEISLFSDITPVIVMPSNWIRFVHPAERAEYLGLLPFASLLPHLPLLLLFPFSSQKRCNKACPVADFCLNNVSRYIFVRFG